MGDESKRAVLARERSKHAVTRRNVDSGSRHGVRGRAIRFRQLAATTGLESIHSERHGGVLLWPDDTEVRHGSRRRSSGAK